MLELTVENRVFILIRGSAAQALCHLVKEQEPSAPPENKDNNTERPWGQPLGGALQPAHNLCHRRSTVQGRTEHSLGERGFKDRCPIKQIYVTPVEATCLPNKCIFSASFSRPPVTPIWGRFTFQFCSKPLWVGNAGGPIVIPPRLKNNQADVSYILCIRIVIVTVVRLDLFLFIFFLLLLQRKAGEAVDRGAKALLLDNPATRRILNQHIIN